MRNKASGGCFLIGIAFNKRIFNVYLTFIFNYFPGLMRVNLKYTYNKRLFYIYS